MTHGGDDAPLALATAYERTEEHLHRLIAILSITLSLASFSCGAQPAASASTSPMTVAAFAQSALLAMQLPIKRGEQDGAVYTPVALCVAALDSTAFVPVYSRLVQDAFSASEREALEAFFGSDLGAKYSKHGLLQLYSEVGLPRPEPLPTFSTAELQALDAFSRTPAGNKLLVRKLMHSPSAVRAVNAHIDELLSRCERRY